MREAPSETPAGSRELAEIVKRLVAAYHPDRVYLFGSKARGDAGPNSDYDLLVVVSESGDPPYRRAQHAQKALWGLWSAADVLVLTSAEVEARRSVPSSLVAAVLREGKLLHVA